MKWVFITALVLNLLVEGLAAFSLISLPDPAVAEGALSAVSWSRNYGFAALAIASTIFWIWPHRDNFKVVSVVLGMLMTFHIGVCLSLGMSGQWGVTILHGVMAVLFVALFLLRTRWCIVSPEG